MLVINKNYFMGAYFGVSPYEQHKEQLKQISTLYLIM